jgi:hypothetical protein
MPRRFKKLGFKFSRDDGGLQAYKVQSGHERQLNTGKMHQKRGIWISSTRAWAGSIEMKAHNVPELGSNPGRETA